MAYRGSDASVEHGAVNEEVIEYIARLADRWPTGNGTERSVISLAAASSISQRTGLPIKWVEIAALRQEVIPLRYLRNMGTIGPQGQIRMLESTVAVVGAGGLGGIVVELLARTGTGHIIVIDSDCFSESDLNRQLMSTPQVLGQSKVVVTAERARAVSPSTEVTPCRKRLTPRNACRLLRGAEVVVDGLDNLPSRFAAERACRDLQIPYIHGTIAGLGGQLMTVFPKDAGLSSIYGPPNASSGQGIEASLGTPAVTPAIIAALQVQEVVKIVTGIGVPIRNQMLLVDVSRGSFDTVNLGG